jgi:hypothetical protein
MMIDVVDCLNTFESIAPRSLRLLERTFEWLSKERIVPTPENYAIWYTYFSGHQPDLNREIDKAHPGFRGVRSRHSAAAIGLRSNGGLAIASAPSG